MLTSAAFVGWQSAYFMGSWFVGLFLLIWIWLIQVRVLGRFWLGACTTGKARSVAVRALGWISALQLAVVLSSAPSWRLAAHIRSDPEFMGLMTETDPTLGSFDGYMLTSFVLLVLTLFSLAAVGCGVLALGGRPFRFRQGHLSGLRRPVQRWPGGGPSMSPVWGPPRTLLLYGPAAGYVRIDALGRGAALDLAADRGSPGGGRLSFS